jgi:hypothetical protein
MADKAQEAARRQSASMDGMIYVTRGIEEPKCFLCMVENWELKRPSFLASTPG